MSVARYSVGIVADKDSVVVLFRFIDHPVVYEEIEHVAVDPTLKHQIREDPAHIIVGLREHKRLLWLPFHGR